jgi:hypothetical protein
MDCAPRRRQDPSACSTIARDLAQLRMRRVAEPDQVVECLVGRCSAGRPSPHLSPRTSPRTSTTFARFGGIVARGCRGRPAGSRTTPGGPPRRMPDPPTRLPCLTRPAAARGDSGWSGGPELLGCAVWGVPNLDSWREAARPAVTRSVGWRCCARSRTHRDDAIHGRGKGPLRRDLEHGFGRRRGRAPSGSQRPTQVASRSNCSMTMPVACLIPVRMASPRLG